MCVRVNCSVLGGTNTQTAYILNKDGTGRGILLSAAREERIKAEMGTCWICQLKLRRRDFFLSYEENVKSVMQNLTAAFCDCSSSFGFIRPRRWALACMIQKKKPIKRIMCVSTKASGTACWRNIIIDRGWHFPDWWTRCEIVQRRHQLQSVN